MSGSVPFRCATAARDRRDPQPGSAPQTRGWLLLPHPGPWPIDAVAGSGISPPLLARLQQASAGAGVRILLVRRPGRPVAGPARRWRLCWLGGATTTGEWRDDSDLDAAITALAGPAERTTSQTAEIPGEPVILVCTHGVHDACCAIRGRPVAAALAARWPDRVWECSHVGGDRFAPNVLVLPDGYYYGNLDPTRAVEVVQQHLSGTVPAAALRGIAEHPPVVQAAVVAAYERFGPLGPGAVQVVGGESGPGPRTRVRLVVAGIPEAVDAVVHTVRRPDAQLTCRAIRPTPASEYPVDFRRNLERPGFGA